MARPLTVPVVAPIVATAGILLIQEPPGGVLAWMIVALTHTADGPVMGAGVVLTVIPRVMLQLVSAV